MKTRILFLTKRDPKSTIFLNSITTLGYEIVTSEDPSKVLNQKDSFDIILIRDDLASIEPNYLARLIKTLAPQIKTILVASNSDYPEDVFDKVLQIPFAKADIEKTIATLRGDDQIVNG